MTPQTGESRLDALDALVGRWNLTSSLDAPGGIAVIGYDDERGTLLQHYFDSRGVARVYDMSLDGGTWRLERTDPDFSQRFVGVFDESGDKISGAWEISMDGAKWEHDFHLAYRRWASPVWFATEDFHNHYWVSHPDARHSTNLVARAELGITIFDSQQPPGTGLGVYLSAVGGPVPEHEPRPRTRDLLGHLSKSRSARMGAFRRHRTGPLGCIAPPRSSGSSSPRTMNGSACHASDQETTRHPNDGAIARGPGSQRDLG